METKFSSLPLYLLIMALLSICCKTNDPVEETYIPLITNRWTDIARENHKFDLTSLQEGASKGAFNGFEVYTDSTVSFPINGTFSNRNVSFIVTRRGRDTTYTGRFTADTLIDCGALKIFRRR